MKEKKYIIGLDGGGTNTHCVLFNDGGKILSESHSSGSNLNIYKKDAIDKILNLINQVTYNAEIALEDVSAIGLGLAGVSDLAQRELLLKELDKKNISNKSLILSDIEAAYQILCPAGVGCVISVGTGIIGLGRNSENSVKVAGKGHENGDLGSGYWIGKQAIKNLILNYNISSIDKEIKDFDSLIKNRLKINSFDEMGDITSNNPNYVSVVASLAKDVIDLALRGNDLALSIVQEATTYVADYIIYMFNELDFDKDNVIIGCNGSIIANNFYRRMLDEALQFDFQKIHWVFSKKPIAFGAGYIASKYFKIKINNNIVKGNINC